MVNIFAQHCVSIRISSLYVYNILCSFTVISYTTPPPNGKLWLSLAACVTVIIDVQCHVLNYIEYPGISSSLSILHYVMFY